MTNRKGTRYLLYSHDTYGLGHFRRSCLLASGLVRAHRDNDVLIATGSPRAQSFRLPERVDSLKLPAATKTPDGEYGPRKLNGGLDRLVRLRSSLLLSAVVNYEPDVILVDHAPLGMSGELLPVLQACDRPNNRVRLVLGLREIIDDATRVDADWHRDGVWDWIDIYDDILVYGDERLLTTAVELNVASRTRAKVAHTGFVAPVMPEAATTEPFLLITPGGGGDGQAMLRRYLDAVEEGATSGVRSVLVTGPLLSARRRAELLIRAQKLPSVEVVEFTDQMRSLVASSSGVISMAGYNTVVEELAAGVPALLVPRTAPRLEQDIRARRLASHSWLQYCPTEQFTGERVERFVASCLASSPDVTAVDQSLDLSGVATAIRCLTSSSGSPQKRVPIHV